MGERDEDVLKPRSLNTQLKSSTNMPRDSWACHLPFLHMDFFHGVGSCTKVSGNRENTQERILKILLIECPANVSNSFLHIREQKLVIQSEEWQNAL